MGKSKQRYARWAVIATTVLVGMLGISGTHLLASDNEASGAPGRTMARQAVGKDRHWTTVDHTKHTQLKQTFTSGAQITQACLSCHSEAASQFRDTIHWTWKAHGGPDGAEKGKAGLSLNNFCISTNNNADTSCLACHPGWGEKTEAVNCLACHSQKSMNFDEAFEDFNAFTREGDAESLEIAGEIQTEIQNAAQKIQMPQRQNCGSCHFYGGGGDGVKHGDLDSSLTKPGKSLDVHMGTDGQNFDCTRCHTTTSHNIAGRVYTVPAAMTRKSLIEDDLTAKITCESCHSATPHQSSSKANDHTDKVACQTCHIPEFARINPTKMSWDWSQAGKKREGKPYKTKDDFGKYDYMSIKGQMKWDKNIEPEYFWYNGSIDSVTLKSKVDPQETVAVSRPVGSMDDENARIYPFKVHKGVQPYDKVHRNLLAPLLSGEDGYWKTLDWQRALTKGMAAVSLPYSGKFDFVETTYVFPITHMVAPKEDALTCKECHVENEGRMAELAGFYMPGRDVANPVDTLGWMLILGSLVGVTLHGLGRIFTNGRKGE